MSAMEGLAATPPAGQQQMRPNGARLYRIRKTCLKMLSKRGYTVADEELNGTAAAFVTKFGEDPGRDQMMLFVERTDDPSDQLMVFFPEEEKVGVKPIKSFCDQMQQNNVSRAIMVVKHSITPFAKQAIQEMAENYKIEYFRDSELLVDITEHRLVPTHNVLDNVQKAELLKRSQPPPPPPTPPTPPSSTLRHQPLCSSTTTGREDPPLRLTFHPAAATPPRSYRLREGQLPRIQKDDPVARYYGLEKGQVVKIIRNSETAGRYVTYRVCI